MNKLILIVDDEPMIRHLLNQLLRLDGYVVQEASDGEDAILKVKHKKPDLIVMDYMMPNLDGLSACRELRRQPDMDDVPIIMLSAITKPEIIEKSLNAGANRFLDKTGSIPDGLTNLIHQYLSSPNSNLLSTNQSN